MARGKQLQDLVTQLRAEIGTSQSVSVGVSQVDNLKVRLARMQEILYDDYDWPFLNIQRTISLQAGQRYYDLPSNLNYDRIECVKYQYGNVFTDVERGITFDDYSIYNSMDGDRSSPVLKWDVRNTGSNEQLEIWPIPSEEGTVHFFGTKSLSALVQNEDRADLDDKLIVLFVAAEYLKNQKSPEADGKLSMANSRLLKLRGNSQAASKTVQIGLGNRNRAPYAGKTIVVVR